MRLPLHRVQLMRPTRRTLAARAPWMRAIAVAFFAVALALLGIGVIPGSPVEALGWALVAFGVVHAADAVASDGLQARGLLGAVGAAYAVSGSLLLVDPVLGRIILLTAASVSFILGGIVLAVAAVASRHAQWTTAAASGVAIAGYGAAVALEWPVPADPALAITFGLAAAAQGAACLRLARAGYAGARSGPGTGGGSS